MKIYFNSEMIVELKDFHEKVIKNDIEDIDFEGDIKRRIQYVLLHKYSQCLERLKKEWLPKLKTRVEAIPTDEESLIQLIFSQNDYKSRSQREEELNGI